MVIGGHQNPDTAKFGCTNATKFTPHKGYAILQTRDAGTPQMVILKPTGTSVVPKEILIKRMGQNHWSRFDPSKASRTPMGDLVVHADRVWPTPAWYSDKFFPEVLRSEKLYPLEVAKMIAER